MNAAAFQSHRRKPSLIPFSPSIGWAPSETRAGPRVSRAGIVLTLVTRNSEGHLAYRSQSEPPRGRGTTLGGSTDDPRREGTRPAAACHPAGGAVGQCQPGLPRGGDLPRLVLPLARAVGALRPGRGASAAASRPPRSTGAAGPGDGAAAAERGGQRGDVGRESDRRIPAPSLAAARGAQHGAASPATRRAGDTPAAADRARAPRSADGRLAHPADPPHPVAGAARPAPACGPPRARRGGVSGHPLHPAAQERA